VTTRLPPGVRDYLPGAAARRRGTAATVARELERWGYRGIITPLFEYDAVLSRGLDAPPGPAKKSAAMRFVEPATGEVVALRPDFTPQVARLVATRMHAEPGPLRLHYQGSVVRLDGARREVFQVGVELIDAPRTGGDLEVVSLAEAALSAVGVAAVIDLGHAALVRAILDLVDGDARAAVSDALAKKDRARAAELAAQLPLPERRKALLSALPTLYGGADVLERARPLCDSPPEHRALDELGALHASLTALGDAARLSIDLGEPRSFAYYTGVRFSLFADGAPGPLVSGGRYDDLVARYGRSARAAGFALDVDGVAEWLASRGVAAPEASGGVLVAGARVPAAKLAAELRAQGSRAVLALDDDAAETELRAQAKTRGLDRIAVAAETTIRWLDEPGDKR
jgi:ATP phosphoribosyltransferase regulatory subunit